MGRGSTSDTVTPNPDVEFTETAPGNFVSSSLNPVGTRFSELTGLRRAAFTTLVADQLHDFAKRTGQTRFVVDGQIVDISGYQRR